jgi:hypothetical protein
MSVYADVDVEDNAKLSAPDVAVGAPDALAAADAEADAAAAVLELELELQAAAGKTARTATAAKYLSFTRGSFHRVTFRYSMPGPGPRPRGGYETAIHGREEETMTAEESTAPPTRILLAGIVGSTAYGLARAGSDIDRLGVFAAPTEQVISLRGLPAAEQTVRVDNDTSYHEARKFAALALAVNPTVTELLWLPPDLLEIRTPLGDALTGIRAAFLSSTEVQHSYRDYATAQFRRLRNRGDGSFSSDTRKRTAKHARHLARLLTQGRQLYATGELTLRLDDPQWYLDFGDKVAAGDLDACRHLLDDTASAFTGPSPLPEHPDIAAAEAWLQEVRRAHYRPPPPPQV